MAENHIWSASFGRWFGIPVRIHVLLILFIALIFGLEWNFRHLLNPAAQGTAIVTVVVLMFSILVHELGHLFAISNLGGYCGLMVLTPWGGSSEFSTHESGKARTVIHLAGPFVNGIIFLFGAMLLTRHWQAELLPLINPFRPHAFEAAEWEHSLLQIVTWINFQLLVVNLIPCFPFDGAAAIRGIIDSLNVDLPSQRTESAVMAMGHAVAFTMLGMAWLLRDSEAGTLQPAWFVLLVAGITLIFSARYSYYRNTIFEDSDWDEIEGSDFDVDFPHQFDSREEEESFFEYSEFGADAKGPYSQWLLEKQEARLKEDSIVEAREERQADEILEKLHGRSVDCLSESERLLLNRVSERIRRRREQGVN